MPIGMSVKVIEEKEFASCCRIDLSCRSPYRPTLPPVISTAGRNLKTKQSHAHDSLPLQSQEISLVATRQATFPTQETVPPFPGSVATGNFGIKKKRQPRRSGDDAISTDEVSRRAEPLIRNSLAKKAQMSPSGGNILVIFNPANLHGPVDFFRYEGIGEKR
jgi:hypothetical protein